MKFLFVNTFKLKMGPLYTGIYQWTLTDSCLVCDSRLLSVFILAMR